MRRRASKMRSWSTVTRAKMNRLGFLVLCATIGGSFGYNARREAPYNEGPNVAYNLDYSNYQSEPSQRLFWGNQGSNQVGGTGLWGTLTNKFPFLSTMFGRMELPSEYGAPNQYSAQTLAAQSGLRNQLPAQALAAEYGTPNQYSTQAFTAQSSARNQYPAQTLATEYGVPNQYHTHQEFVPPERYQTQFYQAQQYNRQPNFRQGFAPAGRDVALTDDAVIVTPPFVPAAGAVPAPLPPAPQPPQQPQVPISAPTVPSQPPQDQFSGYNYDKPHYRLDLPYK